MDRSPHRRALLLEYFTVGYNIAEGVFSVTIGLLSGSVALTGFGFDSAIESLSGSVLIWRLTRHGKISEEEEARVERLAVRLVAVSFFILAAYVAFLSVKKLYLFQPPEPSLPGIIIAILSLIIMPVLSFKKRSVGRDIGSRSLVADSKQTLLCSYLSAAVLTGLALNYLFGLWWADPAAGLVIVALIVKEGIETLREGKTCSC